MLKKGWARGGCGGVENMYMYIYTHDTGSINFRLLSLLLTISLAAHAFPLNSTRIVECELYVAIIT